ncbi:MAG: DUF2851 family protein [Muribaculaceae bacterium]|nr:DUF2851 family protein [Muribaculaceae bacterium]
MERLYQYLWKHKMLGKELWLTSGEKLEILSPGMWNTDAGPDFSNAKLRIDDTVWTGNVEIHCKASDWYRHGHDNDRAYDSVLLHVVADNDGVVTRPDGETIPQVQISFPDSFYNLYSALSENIKAVKCERALGRIPQLLKVDWLESLGVERMQIKADRVLNELKNLGGDWERTCFVTFARALGFGLNGEPFEILARSIPMGYLHRHADNLLQLEALLFGQAGMLDSSIHIFDEYYQRLCREYFFLARKYGLRPMRRDLWKYSRTRPQNFPHRRIALLAKTLEGGFSMMSRMLALANDPAKLRDLFSWELGGYWLTHSDFDRETPMEASALGQGSIDLLLINLVAPVLYAHAAAHGDAEKGDEALNMWRNMRPERNTYIRQWRDAGIDCEDAMCSQALLQLRKEYCDGNRCLDCRFGHWLLRENVNPQNKDYWKNLANFA